MSCYLYHICRESDKFDFSKGYIGISSNPVYRWLRHKKYEQNNSHLTRAYEKYTDIIEYVVVKGTREYCLMLEKALRPVKRIGWNQIEGGGDPPLMTGKIMSDLQKEKIGKANSGIKSGTWKGYWWAEGIRYDTLKDAALVHKVTTKCVYDRAHNPKFNDWFFEAVKNAKEDDERRVQRVSN